VTISDPIPGPCNLLYSDPAIVAGRLAPMVPSVPTVGCGGATGYSIAPPLPAGLVIAGATGVISGTPTVAQGPLPYTVTASNAFGTTTAAITIEVEEPIFELFGDDPTIPYSPANGIASGEIDIFIEELPSPSQGGSRNIAGYSFGMAVDATKVSLVAVLEGVDQAAMNGGLGADFFAQNINVAGGLTVGAIFDLQQAVFLVADLPREIIQVQFASVPAFLVGDLDGASVPLPIVGNLGVPPVQVVVTIGGQSALPQTVTPTIHFDP